MAAGPLILPLQHHHDHQSIDLVESPASGVIWHFLPLRLERSPILNFFFPTAIMDWVQNVKASHFTWNFFLVNIDKKPPLAPRSRASSRRAGATMRFTVGAWGKLQYHECGVR